MYQDPAWNLYKNPRAFPRGWLVHDILTHTPDNADDPSGTALVAGDFQEKLDPPSGQDAVSAS